MAFIKFDKVSKIYKMGEVEKKPVPIDPELAEMMKDMKPLEGKENPIDKTKISKGKKKK